MEVIRIRGLKPAIYDIYVFEKLAAAKYLRGREAWCSLGSRHAIASYQISKSNSAAKQTTKPTLAIIRFLLVQGRTVVAH